MRAAKISIDSYISKAKDLDTVIGAFINPLSKQKTLLERMTAPKAGEQRNIVLKREEKNEILLKARPLLDQTNQFIFDFNRFGKTLAERDFSEKMLIMGQLIDNLKKFASVVQKSNTVKDCLAKLLEKLGNINVDFRQQIKYENSGSQVASFSHHQQIEDHQAKKKKKEERERETFETN